jgi:methyl-accepting chemotaxis protein
MAVTAAKTDPLLEVHEDRLQRVEDAVTDTKTVVSSLRTALDLKTEDLAKTCERTESAVKELGGQMSDQIEKAFAAFNAKMDQHSELTKKMAEKIDQHDEAIEKLAKAEEAREKAKTEREELRKKVFSGLLLSMFSGSSVVALIHWAMQHFH